MVARTRAPPVSPLLPEHTRQMIKSLSQLAFVVGLMLLLVLTLTPGNDMPDIGGFDKVYHALAFLLLAATGYVAFPTRRGLWSLLFGLGLLGAAIEVAQLLVPGRSCDIDDWLADSAGILLGLGLGRLLQRPLGRLLFGTAAR